MFFSYPDLDAVRIAPTILNEGASFIFLVSYGNGKAVVIVKYPDQATIAIERLKGDGGIKE